MERKQLNAPCDKKCDFYCEKGFTLREWTTSSSCLLCATDDKRCVRNWNAVTVKDYCTTNKKK